MNDALAPVTVTPDQLDLVKRTVAAGATDAELKLYLFDCARQGVHPLDRLLHFTKRGGKYTPVTSIDLMRTRAADTGEYAGNDDARFDDEDQPLRATVTVYRIVQGQRCPFTATARWKEYCPPTGQDHMWRKMPATMLGKCAEALALRKGFPRQLAGLYAREEMDQAGSDSQPYVVEVPTKPPQNSPGVQTPDPAPKDRATISAAQQKRLWALARAAGWKDDPLKAWLHQQFQLDSTSAILRAEYDLICQRLKDEGPNSHSNPNTLTDEVFEA
jgi:phage recombination protein Bet